MAVTTKSPMLLSRQRKRGRESRMRSCISSKWTTITRQVAKRRFGEESTNGHCTSKVHKHGFFHIKTQIIMTYGIKLPGVCAGRAPKGANTVQASVHGHRKGPQGNVTGQNDLLYIRLPSTQESAKVLDGRILCTSIYMYLRHWKEPQGNTHICSRWLMSQPSFRVCYLLQGGPLGQQWSKKNFGDENS